MIKPNNNLKTCNSLNSKCVMKNYKLFVKETYPEFLALHSKPDPQRYRLSRSQKQPKSIHKTSRTSILICRKERKIGFPVQTKAKPDARTATGRFSPAWTSCVWSACRASGSGSDRACGESGSDCARSACCEASGTAYAAARPAPGRPAPALTDPVPLFRICLGLLDRSDR